MRVKNNISHWITSQSDHNHSLLQDQSLDVSIDILTMAHKMWEYDIVSLSLVWPLGDGGWSHGNQSKQFSLQSILCGRIKVPTMLYSS